MSSKRSYQVLIEDKDEKWQVCAVVEHHGREVNRGHYSARVRVDDARVKAIESPLKSLSENVTIVLLKYDKLVRAELVEKFVFIIPTATATPQQSTSTTPAASRQQSSARHGNDADADMTGTPMRRTYVSALMAPEEVAAVARANMPQQPTQTPRQKRGHEDDCYEPMVLRSQRQQQQLAITAGPATQQEEIDKETPSRRGGLSGGRAYGRGRGGNGSRRGRATAKTFYEVPFAKRANTKKQNDDAFEDPFVARSNRFGIFNRSRMARATSRASIPQGVLKGSSRGPHPSQSGSSARSFDH